MKKTILIAGGTSVVSLAVGAAGGYFFAKRRFDKEIAESVDRETRAVAKHYSILLMEAQSGKPANPQDIPRKDDADKGGLEDAGELSEDEREELVSDELHEEEERQEEKRQTTADRARQALTDYQGISTGKIVSSEKPDPGKLVENNIFASNERRKSQLPPRDGNTGRFVPRHSSENEGQQREPEKTPYMITMEEYLADDMSHDQKSLRYFKQDNTLIDVEDNDEPYEIGKIGEVNLTLFPEPDENGKSIICVRNEALATDYEIQLMTESLTDYMGLGENAGDDEDEDEDDLDPAAYL